MCKDQVVPALEDLCALLRGYGTPGREGRMGGIYRGARVGRAAIWRARDHSISSRIADIEAPAIPRVAPGADRLRPGAG